ncbi:hypothetical protein EDC01DRAFT_729681 [Geopyxis carbonaria]|nr:hypothetical protein EDC01DRAFT_729681 [Geopyxis carbonaria]
MKLNIALLAGIALTHTVTAASNTTLALATEMLDINQMMAEHLKTALIIYDYNQKPAEFVVLAERYFDEQWISGIWSCDGNRDNCKMIDVVLNQRVEDVRRFPYACMHKEERDGGAVIVNQALGKAYLSCVKGKRERAIQDVVGIITYVCSTQWCPPGAVCPDAQVDASTGIPA